LVVAWTAYRSRAGVGNADGKSWWTKVVGAGGGSSSACTVCPVACSVGGSRTGDGRTSDSRDAYFSSTIACPIYISPLVVAIGMELSWFNRRGHSVCVAGAVETVAASTDGWNARCNTRDPASWYTRNSNSASFFPWRTDCRIHSRPNTSAC
jgi:hypothetical protein